MFWPKLSINYYLTSVLNLTFSFFSLEQIILFPYLGHFQPFDKFEFPRGHPDPPPPNPPTTLDPPCRNHQSYTHVWYDIIQLNVHTMFIQILYFLCSLSFYFCSGVWQGRVFSHCLFIFWTGILQRRAFTHFMFIFVVVHGRGVYSSTDFDAQFW